MKRAGRGLNIIGIWIFNIVCIARYQLISLSFLLRSGDV